MNKSNVCGRMIKLCSCGTVDMFDVIWWITKLASLPRIALQYSRTVHCHTD